MTFPSPRPVLVTLGSLAALVGVAGACGKGILSSNKETTVVNHRPAPKSKDADVNGKETLPTSSGDANGTGDTTGEPKVTVTQAAVQTDPTEAPRSDRDGNCGSDGHGRRDENSDRQGDGDRRCNGWREPRTHRDGNRGRDSRCRDGARLRGHGTLWTHAHEL